MLSESRYRLAGIVCLLLLAGFVANSISSYFVSRDSVRRTITESSLPLTSDNLYTVIQRDLLKPIFISSMMANDAFLRHWTLSGEQEVERITSYLHEIRKEYETVTSFFVSEATRNYYFADGVLKQVHEDDPRDDWYFRVRQMEEPFEINIDPDLANKDAMTIFVNYRVYDFAGKYIGAAGTGLTVNRVKELVEDYEQRFGRDIFFCDREGTMVLSPTRSRLQNYASIHDIPGLGSLAEELLQERLDGVSYEKDGDTYFLNSRFVPELDWFLMVEQTEDRLLAPLQETLLLNICLALGITAVVAFICISAINRHQRKLEISNRELSRMNLEVERQKRQVEHAAKDLESANELLSALNREKDDFVGIVAHDLRNPLGWVLGFCEEIRCELPERYTELHGFLTKIRNSGHQMLELVDDILNVSSIESFHGEPNLEPQNWNHLARDARERFRDQADRKEIVLTLQLDEKADVKVFTRVQWMAICLNNLVSNAIKYAPPGSKVTIGTTGGNDEVELSVTDRGCGLKPEELDQVFGKFVRLSSKPTGGESSSGLGLYIVRKICTRLGAAVTIESQTGSGTRLTIKHPIRSEQGCQQASTQGSDH